MKEFATLVLVVILLVLLILYLAIVLFPFYLLSFFLMVAGLFHTAFRAVFPKKHEKSHLVLIK